ncbi:hypothetical protein ABZY19_38140 [Streptomyces sp. NPDC006475]|uniref:hypothetical protein n=1 Tax=Streptomyces sp. NPDC006475 TaxID=3155719 RepID=UPI0033A4A87D
MRLSHAVPPPVMHHRKSAVSGKDPKSFPSMVRERSAMRAIRTMVAAGATLAVLGVTAEAANAATTDTVTCGTVSAADPTDGDEIKLAGTACFHSDGDWFSVTDENSDGYHVEVHWQTNYDRMGICKNSSGAGTKVTCNYDMREGASLLFKVYAYNNLYPIMGGAEKRVTI